MTSIFDTSPLRVGRSGLSSARTSTDEISRSKTREQLSKELAQAKSSDTASLPEPSKDIAGRVSALNANNALGIAKQAIDKVVELRERQLELAETAKESSSPEQRTALDAESTDIQTEIQRVTTQATFNGQSVLNSGVASNISIESIGVNDSVVIGNAQAITQDLGISLSSVEDATAAVETLTDTINSAYSYQSGVEVAQSKTESILRKVVEPSVDDTIESEAALQSIEEAEALAESVASDLTDIAYEAAVPEETVKLVQATTKGLSSDKVSALTEE